MKEENKEEVPARAPGRYQRRDHGNHVTPGVFECSAASSDLLANIRPLPWSPAVATTESATLAPRSTIVAYRAAAESLEASHQRTCFRRQYGDVDDCRWTCSRGPECDGADVRAAVHTNALRAGHVQLEVEDLSQLKANSDPNRFDRKCRPLGSLSPMLSE